MSSKCESPRGYSTDFSGWTIFAHERSVIEKGRKRERERERVYECVRMSSAPNWMQFKNYNALQMANTHRKCYCGMFQEEFTIFRGKGEAEKGRHSNEYIVRHIMCICSQYTLCGLPNNLTESNIHRNIVTFSSNSNCPVSDTRSTTSSWIRMIYGHCSISHTPTRIQWKWQ